MNSPAKMDVSHMDLFYGDYQALTDINISFAEHRVTAMIGPSGCGKSTLLKSLNRMNDLVEGCKITGRITLDGDDIYSGYDVNVLRKKVGMVFQKANPFPMSIYDNIAFGPRTHGIKKKSELDDIVEDSLRKAAIFVKRSFEEECFRTFWRSAAASVHCSRFGGKSRGIADG